MAQVNIFDGYHVQLSDGSNTVGLKICDERGKENPNAIQSGPNPRTAIQVGQSTGYGNFLMPYTPIEISDWTGGRGQEQHEKDATKWYDNNGIVPTPNGLILTGKPTLITLPGVTGTFGAVFFMYYGALFCVTQPDDESGSRLFINGWIGKIRANKAANTQILTSMNLSGVNLAGKTFKFVGYPGQHFDPNYCQVASNTQTGTNDTITLVAPGFTKWWDTRSIFVVEGGDTWNEITGHGLFYGASIPDAVESVATINDIIYFARGDILPIRRGRFNATSGAWEWSDDTAAEGAKVIRAINGQDGKQKIWKLRSTDNSLKRADPVTWGTNLTWTQVNTSQPIGTTDSRATNLLAYDEPPRPWCFKEDEFGSVLNDVYAAVPLGEMRSIRSPYNGKAALQSGVYLYFSTLEQGKIQRYYNQRLDNIGLDTGTGLPIDRQGPVNGMVGYPGRYYVSVDAMAGYSAIYCSLQDEWHEVYRAAQGSRIRGLGMQPRPGSSVTRLWFAVGNQVGWIPVSDNPLRDVNDYKYAASGTLETSWIHGSFGDLPKYWNSVKLFCENTAAGVTIDVDYQVDLQTGWTALPATFTAPVTEVQIATLNNVSGKRIRFRFRMATNAEGVTPRIKRMVIDAVTRIPIKRVWQFSFLVENYHGTGLQFAIQPPGVSQLMTVLDGWADVRTRSIPISFTTIFEPWTDKNVFIEAATVRPYQVINQETGNYEVRMIGRLEVVEV